MSTDTSTTSVESQFPPPSQQTTLKRRASASFPEDPDDSVSRKRMKEEREDSDSVVAAQAGDTVAFAKDSELADQLAQELQCGCCSELVYRPVMVQPCQHFFCGSCCVLWIRNGGSTCPHCRSASTNVTPSRALQSVLDVLLRSAPHKARTERERQQADEVYTGTSPIRIPSPRELSPEPDISPGDFVRPCPNCLPGNPYGWRCPQPIVENSWPLEDGTPPGHALCGNCENVLALPSPLTTKCDFCQVSFCGIGIQGRCIASPISSQHLHNLSDIGDLIQTPAVYECFNSNTVEVEIMLEYLTAQGITPRHIYREIVAHIQAQPQGFLPLIQEELFVDIHGVPAGPEPDADAPRNKICRQCASEVFLYGLRDWFLRERQKGFLEESVLNRKDCVDGEDCTQQTDQGEFNHLIAHTPPAQPETDEQTDEQPQEQTPVAPDVLLGVFDALDSPPALPHVSSPLSGPNLTHDVVGTSVLTTSNEISATDEAPAIHDTANDLN
ncbi:hypothetical protein MSAN_01883200 [Mycena sanguinolenta]|uniref:RING-type domain-containing protein n=1 Tax=Mycena sanguinolenta TaxID=230812 RepID=A0A8H6XUB2_9AGAR|nr:hypothetical protein MSAN_01883200 [Mycena sanguinolenta]